MTFDSSTRNALAAMVGKARERLRTDVADQLRRLGFQPGGAVLDLTRIAGLSETERVAGQELRELLEHFVAAESGGEGERRAAAYDRLVREIGFTTFNRLVALRMAEERGLLVQSVSRGLASAGFQLYERIANGALGGRHEAYRAYLECIYDELTPDLPALFDRTAPESHIFPSGRCLEDLFALLDDPALARLWDEDETVGWVYQYYNDPEERRKMREASAPRSSRELAVRNQFFTPRYVVEFLTDNTLGRLWYQMRQGNTLLSEACAYLVVKANDVFLGPGEKPPAETESAECPDKDTSLSVPTYVPYRTKKDPRDLKVLDPACGSGHFLLHAFDLLETVYEEGWSDHDGPRSEVTGRSLREDWPDLADLRRRVPEMILRHNLYGVDIDPRACQIAATALWLRAQRSYQRLGMRSEDRPILTKGNIVIAEPMPGEQSLLEQFLVRLDPPLIGGLVRLVFERMRLAGEAGLLLKLEEELREAIHSAKLLWEQAPPAEQLSLLPPTSHQTPEQLLLPNISGITDQVFWTQIEGRVREALAQYAVSLSNGDTTRKRLFAEDAARGFALVDLAFMRFDVILMNPPFGASSLTLKKELRRTYPRTKNDLFAAFIERGVQLLSCHGMLGAITSRTGFYLSSFHQWREEILLKEAPPVIFADLGYGVLDDAMVEVAAYCLEAAR